MKSVVDELDFASVFGNRFDIVAYRLDQILPEISPPVRGSWPQPIRALGRIVLASTQTESRCYSLVAPYTSGLVTGGYALLAYEHLAGATSYKLFSGESISESLFWLWRMYIIKLYRKYPGRRDLFLKDLQISTRRLLTWDRQHCPNPFVLFEDSEPISLAVARDYENELDDGSRDLQDD